MYMRVIEESGGRIVAACDRELMGKVLREGKIMLDLKKHGGFYKGEICTKEELKNALKGATSANLVGEKCVGCAVECGIADRGACIYVQGVAHLQIYRL